MTIFCAIMASLSFLMMAVQNSHKDRFAYALICIVSLLMVGANEIIPIFLA